MSDTTKTTVKSPAEMEAELANRDPITGAAGAHPLGVGVGAAGGGVAGAAIGSIAGPVGGAIGAAVGAVAGGLAGKAVAEQVDPTVELTYWRTAYVSRPYVERGASFDNYEPAYRYGYMYKVDDGVTDFDAVEPRLATEWEKNRGKSTLSWDSAKAAVRDAWNRRFRKDNR